MLVSKEKQMNLLKEIIKIVSSLCQENLINVVVHVIMGRPASSDLIRVLQNRVKRKSILVTDSLYSYKNLASFLHLNHIKIPSTKHRLGNYNIQKINSLHSKIKSSPLLIKGEQPFRNSNFKGRPPICIRLGLLIPFITN